MRIRKLCKGPTDAAAPHSRGKLMGPPGFVGPRFSQVGIIESRKPGALRAEDVASALADPYARRVLAACVRQARAVKDISQEAGLPLPTSYRHVSRLVEAGLLVVERSALTPDGKRYELYRSRLRSARIELDGTGERVTWEANEPVEARLANLWGTLRSEAGRP